MLGNVMDCKEFGYPRFIYANDLDIELLNKDGCLNDGCQPVWCWKSFVISFN